MTWRVNSQLANQFPPPYDFFSLMSRNEHSRGISRCVKISFMAVAWAGRSDVHSVAIRLTINEGNE